MKVSTILINMLSFLVSSTDVPIVTCSKYEHYATLGKPMTLGCDVQSSPPATVSWTWKGDQQLNSGMVDEDNHLAAEEKVC